MISMIMITMIQLIILIMYISLYIYIYVFIQATHIYIYIYIHTQSLSLSLYIYIYIYSIRMSIRLAPRSCLHIPRCWVLTAGHLHELECSGRSSEYSGRLFWEPCAHDASCTKQLHNVAAAGNANGSRMHARFPDVLGRVRVGCNKYQQWLPEGRTYNRIIVVVAFCETSTGVSERSNKPENMSVFFSTIC